MKRFKSPRREHSEWPIHTARRARPLIESLENRLLLSAHVISVAADNRGLAVLFVDQDLNAATVNGASALIFTAGPDGQFNTGDDVAQATAVNYNAPLRAITVAANIPADARYRLVLNGSAIQSADGSLLDGEFNGAAVPSGNGVPGGNYDIVTSPRNTLARFSTIVGNIDVNLDAERTPQTVGNFIAYANAGSWDGTFFHRTQPGILAQGGGFNVTADNKIAPIASRPPVVNEPGLHNVRGTIAMAKLAGDPNSATSQWFFNVTDNSQSFDFQNQGFAVFGQVADAAGLTAMDAVSNFQRVNAGAPFDTLPVRDLPAVQARNNQLDPNADLIFVNRVSLLMDVESTPTPVPPLVLVGAGQGGGPELRVFDGATTERFSTFVHLPSFGGGLRVAKGDLNGDGVIDYITGTGIGASHVKVIDGRTGAQLAGALGSFLAFPGNGDPADPTSDYYRLSFKGGVFVASGDVNGDGRTDLVVSADVGGTPHVKVFSGTDGSLIASFFAYDAGFAGGVRVAAGDVNGDGHADIITGAGSAAPHVRVFDGRTGAMIANYFAYDPGFQGGIYVAAGDTNGDGRADVITGTGVGPPHVKVFDIIDFFNPPLLKSFFAYDPTFPGGVRVATADINGDGRADIITGSGPGAAHAKVFNATNLAELESFIAAPQFDEGIYVG